MDPKDPKISPQIFPARDDIVLDIVADNHFINTLSSISEQILAKNPLIEATRLDDTQIRYTIPNGNVRSTESRITLYFLYVIARNYQGRAIDAWKDGLDIVSNSVDSVSLHIFDINIIKNVVDKLLKILINKHYQTCCFYTGQHSGQSSLYCSDCHNFVGFLRDVLYADRSLRNWYLIPYERNGLTKWIFRKRIAEIHQALDEITKARQSILIPEKELSDCKAQINEFLRSDTVSKYDPEKVEALYQKQHELYQKLIAAIKPSLDRANALKK